MLHIPAPKETPVLILDAVSDQNRHSKYAIQNRKDYEAFAAQFNTADIKVYIFDQADINKYCVFPSVPLYRQY